eukprot:CAMPEP_0170739140 /NCGR_PEP_ID=MMETSP0437-20130122/5006_1 /TAXON_ID=0 /ORGANISM="Sexangularia sp." /LENGTH=1163 /DNA_ID=CAMNT_0011077583 /DNA_START=152 /DNA_END=3643 /DNA_ORIENTATION=+
MSFNDESQAWTPLHDGLGYLFILASPSATAARLVGAVASAQQPVMNLVLGSDTVSQRPSSSFVQGKAAGTIFGLNFAKEADAERVDKLLSTIVPLITDDPSDTAALAEWRLALFADEAPTAMPSPSSSKKSSSSSRRASSASSKPRDRDRDRDRKDKEKSRDKDSEKDKDKDKDKDVSTDGEPTKKVDRGFSGEDALADLPAHLRELAGRLSSSSSTMPSRPRRVSTGSPTKPLTPGRSGSMGGMGMGAAGAPGLGARKLSFSSVAGDLVESRNGAAVAAADKDDDPAPADDVPMPPTGEVVNLVTERDPAVIAKLSTRTKIVREVYTSEAKYMEGLMLLEHEYLPKLTPILREDEQKIIFSNFVSIKNFNKTLLKELRGRVSEWDGAAALGDVFHGLLPFFKLYETYCNNHEVATAKLIEAKKRKEVRKALEASETAVKMSIESLLITPVQRIPRYVLLLRDLLRHTHKAHPDRGNLRTALRAVQNTASAVNSAMKRDQAVQRFAELSKSRKYAWIESLMEPHREFIDAAVDTDGKSSSKPPLSVTLGARRYTNFFLFNDLLVLADDKGMLGLRLPLAAVWVEDVVDPVHAKFMLETPESEAAVFVVDCAVAGDKNKWVDTISRAVDAWLVKCEIPTDTVDDVRVLDYVYEGGPEKGDRHEGPFRAGRPHGTGVLHRANGDVFEGTWVDGKMEGDFVVHYESERLEYRGSMSGGVPSGIGSVRTLTDAESLEKSDVYVGEWKNGAKEGEGRMVWSGRAEYSGQWSANRPHGTGELRVKGGFTYSGEWVYGLKSGRGVLRNADGSFYDGGFDADLFAGDGTLVASDGSVYSGAWKDGKRHGHGLRILLGVEAAAAAGTSSSAAGSSSSGSMSRQSSHGSVPARTPVDSGGRSSPAPLSGRRSRRSSAAQQGGSVPPAPPPASGAPPAPPPLPSTMSSGKSAVDAATARVAAGAYLERYEGTWLNDKYEGTGSLVLPSGWSYTGQFHSGKPHGKGRLETGAGESYEGELKHGEYDGVGVWSGADGSTYDGQFESGRRHGTGTLTFPSGDVYTGDFKNGQRSGRGKLRSPDSKYWYDGEWFGDRKEGTGTSFGDFGVFEGSFRRNMRHGAGTWKRADGRVLVAEWADGIPVGQATLDSQNVHFDAAGTQRIPPIPGLAYELPSLV